MKDNTFPAHFSLRNPIMNTLFRDWATLKFALLSTCHATSYPNSSSEPRMVANVLPESCTRRGQEYEQANGILQKLLVRQSELRVMQQTAAGQQEELKAQLTEQGMRQSALQQACSSQNMVYDAAREKAEQAKALFEQVQNQRAGFQKRYAHRSEERRVGKECRSRWSPYH